MEDKNSLHNRLYKNGVPGRLSESPIRPNTSNKALVSNSKTILPPSSPHSNVNTPRMSKSAPIRSSTPLTPNAFIDHMNDMKSSDNRQKFVTFGNTEFESLQPIKTPTSSFISSDKLFILESKIASSAEAIA